MQQLVKLGVQQLGYDIVQHVPIPVNTFDVLDYIVEAHHGELRRRGFVQIGANDGVRSDPIHHLVKRYELPGILVEPLPDLFVCLQSNYAGCSYVEFENAAVGEADGEAVLYRVQPSPDLPDWLQGIASFNRGHLTAKKFGVPRLESYVVPTKVSVLSISSLLEKHSRKDLGMLQVDTEGCDCRIITWAMQAGLRPAVINYEFVHTSPRERVACKQLLIECGYRFLDIAKDTLAIHESIIPQR